MPWKSSKLTWYCIEVVHETDDNFKVPKSFLLLADSLANNKPFLTTFISPTSSDTTRRLPLFIWTGENGIIKTDSNWDSCRRCSPVDCIKIQFLKFQSIAVRLLRQLGCRCETRITIYHEMRRLIWIFLLNYQSECLAFVVRCPSPDEFSTSRRKFISSPTMICWRHFSFLRRTTSVSMESVLIIATRVMQSAAAQTRWKVHLQRSCPLTNKRSARWVSVRVTNEDRRN